VANKNKKSFSDGSTWGRLARESPDAYAIFEKDLALTANESEYYADPLLSKTGQGLPLAC
jgi:hypothetical protein